MTGTRRPRLLVLVVAYNAERTLESTLMRIPASLASDCEVEVLVIDDSSTDATFDRGEAVRRAGHLAWPLRLLFNPVKLGYGGNQKIGFRYAIEHGFDLVALLHGDGQYAPERLPALLAPVIAGQADAVLGSRMLEARPARSRMPIYKVVGNRILSRIQNDLLGTSFSEFHSGYRAYTTAALRAIPFHLDSDGFDFDTQIIVQLTRSGRRIAEVPIPAYSGSEIGPVNGIRYAWDVLSSCLKSRAQDLSLFYDRKFDCPPPGARNAHYYESRFDFPSTHTMALDLIPSGARVVDLGCGGGHLALALRERGCHTTGIDLCPPAEGVTLDAFEIHDLNASPLAIDLTRFDCAVMLDVIEHLHSPERFVDDFLAAAARKPDVKLIASTGNVGFIVVRLMLLLGQFNHGKRGILDVTHTRLFTFATFRRLFETSGFRVLEVRGVPAPFPLAVGNGRLGRALLAVNRALIRVSRSLFSYQILAVVQPRPGLAYLLEKAADATARRSAERP